MSKVIISGEIKDQFCGSPIEMFKKAVEISKEESFEIRTNNTQVIEILEILCGEKNIEYYIIQNDQLYKQNDVQNLYDYIGSIFHIINSIRFSIQLNGRGSNCYTQIKNEIKDYEDKFEQIPFTEISPSKFKKYTEKMPVLHEVEAYQADKKMIIDTALGRRRVSKGEWIIKRKNGKYDVMDDDFFRKKFEV